MNILSHLALLQIKARPLAVAHAPPDLIHEPFDDWPVPNADNYLSDPVEPDEVKILKNLSVR
jgi:hypothetical protein